jgi:hypothetical protein
MLYVGSNDAIKKNLKTLSVTVTASTFNFLGPAQWFLQMHIKQHKDKSSTLNQHCFVLNTLQHNNPNLEFPDCETPSPPDYTFSKDNQPVTDHYRLIIKVQHKRLPFRSAVCTLLYLAYKSRADILFAVCKLAKACFCPGKTIFCALIWLIGYLQQRPYYAIKFYPDTTSNPVYDVCRQHRIPHSNLTVFYNASWQDCPDTGRSTIGY